MTDKVREAIARLRENLAGFDAEVAFELATEGERADLWGEIDVNVEDLRTILAAFDAPAEGEVWRDMDSAPKDGTKFDVWYFEHFDTPAHRVTDVYWSDVQDDFCTDGSYGPEEPTPLMAFPRPAYWHLIPSPPDARS
jgi:hypothetical protein